MIVRDKTLRTSEYKGRWTEASSAVCPCMPCYNAHDCGYTNSQAKWVQRMECASRWNNGCPSPKPEPEHVYSSERGYVCKRCGERRVRE